MPAAQAITGGIRAGTGFASLQQQRKRDAFDQQQTQVENYNSIVGDMGKTLESAKAQFEARLATTSDLPGKQKIMGEWETFYNGIVSNASRAGQLAASRNVPVDPVAQVARLTPFQNLRDLNAEAALAGSQAATAEGQKAGEVSAATQADTLEQIRAKAAGAAMVRGTPTSSAQSITTTDLTKKVTGELQTKVIGNVDRIARLNVIREQINSNSAFLTIGGKAAAGGLNVLDKFGIPIPEAGEEFLIAQTDFVRNSIENINNYIKEITGAQMSEKEANRLRLAQPDPGEGVFGGDGPIKFKAKLDSALEAGALAQARQEYFLEKGIAHDFEGEREPPITLSGMKQILNEKGKEEARIIRANNPDMDIKEVLRQAQENVQRRFGMLQ